MRIHLNMYWQNKQQAGRKEERKKRKNQRHKITIKHFLSALAILTHTHTTPHRTQCHTCVHGELQKNSTQWYQDDENCIDLLFGGAENSSL